jgi:acyl-CoA reductase-like NAD-dependent aldehyde dehydrogenase
MERPRAHASSKCRTACAGAQHGQGVIAMITPWNFPVSLLIIKVAPALLAGNRVVAKAAPTPR